MRMGVRTWMGMEMGWDGVGDGMGMGWRWIKKDVSGETRHRRDGANLGWVPPNP